MDFDISLTEVLLLLGLLLTPVWASMTVGLIAGFLFPRIIFIVGGYVGFWIGIPALGLMAWITATWFGIDRMAVPIGVSVAFGAVGTIGACRWFDRYAKSNPS